MLNRRETISETPTKRAWWRHYIPMVLLSLACTLSLPVSAIYNTEEEEQTASQLLLESWSGDFSEIMDRRVVRALVVHSHTNYFYDGAKAKGIVVELLRELEKDLNRRLKVGNRPFHVAAIPVNRDQLIPMLLQGRAEIIAVGLVPTPELRELVDFTGSALANVSEVIVTSRQGPKLTSLEQLAGRRVYVQRSRSFWDSLVDLNESFEIQGLEPMQLVPLGEYLEQEDILHMVNEGVIPITVVTDYIANAWSPVLKDIVVHKKFAVGIDREVAWAVRPDAPGLKPYVDRFIKNHREGTVLGNILIRRYLESPKYLKGAFENDQNKLAKLEALFKKYADRYDFDYLMLAAQGYQESGLNQALKSKAGAVGIMQLLPSTAADKSVGIPDIYSTENNIHAGAKYLRHLVDTYFNDPEIDAANQFFFALSGYNAGPNRIHRLRKEAVKMGYDPNQWFNNVEVVVAQKVSREPVEYVRNIYRYYVSYLLAKEQEAFRRKAKTDSHCLVEDSACEF